MLAKKKIIIIIIITDLYSAFRSEDTEALDAARGGLSEIEKYDEFTYRPVYIHFTCNELLSQRSRTETTKTLRCVLIAE